MIGAGRRNRTIIVQSPDTAQNEFGERVGTFTDVVSMWAAIEPISAREIQIAQGFASSVSHKITILYRDGISTLQRIKMGDRIFSIAGIIDANDAHEELQLFCTEVR